MLLSVKKRALGPSLAPRSSLWPSDPQTHSTFAATSLFSAPFHYATGGIDTTFPFQQAPRHSFLPDFEIVENGVEVGQLFVERGQVTPLDLEPKHFLGSTSSQEASRAPQRCPDFGHTKCLRSRHLSSALRHTHKKVQSISTDSQNKNLALPLKRKQHVKRSPLPFCHFSLEETTP